MHFCENLPEPRTSFHVSAQVRPFHTHPPCFRVRPSPQNLVASSYGLRSKTRAELVLYLTPRGCDWTVGLNRARPQNDSVLASQRIETTDIKLFTQATGPLPSRSKARPCKLRAAGVRAGSAGGRAKALPSELTCDLRVFKLRRAKSSKHVWSCRILWRFGSVLQIVERRSTRDRNGFGWTKSPGKTFSAMTGGIDRFR